MIPAGRSRRGGGESRQAMRRFAGIALALATLAPAFGGIIPARAALPPIRHVFTIMLENQEMVTTFGAGQVGWPYLARTLPLMGAFVPNYFGTGHNSLDNYIAMVSGQGPNADTHSDCEDATTMGDNGHFSFDADGQAIGVGCTYPVSVQSIATQLAAKGFTWKGYMEDMDARPGVKRQTCQGPFTANTIESPVPPGNPKPTPSYRAKHNPFVYFHNIFDDLAYCDARDVPFTGFFHDLQSEATTPNYSMIVPDQCNDAHDFPTCADGTRGGPQRASQWLKVVVPKILASPAYKHDGLLIIVFDEGLLPLSCCGEKKAPNLAADNNNGGSYGPFTPLATGGGQTGAIMISKYIKPATLSLRFYNHYSYLRSMEDLFGLAHLGYAAQAGLRPFGADIYTAG